MSNTYYLHETRVCNIQLLSCEKCWNFFFIQYETFFVENSTGCWAIYEDLTKNLYQGIRLTWPVKKCHIKLSKQKCWKVFLIPSFTPTSLELSACSNSDFGIVVVNTGKRGISTFALTFSYGSNKTNFTISVFLQVLYRLWNTLWNWQKKSFGSTKKTFYYFIS